MTLQMHDIRQEERRQACRQGQETTRPAKSRSEYTRQSQGSESQGNGKVGVSFILIHNM